jgi:flagellar protein FlaG
MEVTNVGIAARLQLQAVAAPAPQARTAEPAKARLAPPPVTRPEPNEEQVQRVLEALRKDPEFSSPPARVRVDDSTGEFIIQILNEEEQVVRQIPAEEMLRIAARFEQLQGLLFDRRT